MLWVLSLTLRLLLFFCSCSWACSLVVRLAGLCRASVVGTLIQDVLSFLSYCHPLLSVCVVQLLTCSLWFLFPGVLRANPLTSGFLVNAVWDTVITPSLLHRVSVEQSWWLYSFTPLLSSSGVTSIHRSFSECVELCSLGTYLWSLTPHSSSFGSHSYMISRSTLLLSAESLRLVVFCSPLVTPVEGIVAVSAWSRLFHSRVSQRLRFIS
jgi:hypothetical protein